MTHSDTPSSPPEVALIVGGGPGISASCARLFADNGMRVAVAARTPDKPVLEALERSHGVTLYACDASAPEAVAGLFDGGVRELGAPRLVVHNIDGRVAGIFGKTIDEADPGKSVRENMLERIPIGRLGDVDDLMGGLVYLSSPASDFMTGQTIYIDGGYTAI